MSAGSVPASSSERWRVLGEAMPETRAGLGQPGAHLGDHALDRHALGAGRIERGVPGRRGHSHSSSLKTRAAFSWRNFGHTWSRNPTSGIYAEFKQDFAGVGGDVNFVRSTIEARTYYEMFSDVVAVLRLQGGHVTGWGGKDLRMLDHFQMGPNLVRGFAPNGIGPRDIGTYEKLAFAKNSGWADFLKEFR